MNILLVLFLISLGTSILLQVLNWLFRAIPAREAQVQALLAPQLAELRRQYRGMEYQAKERAIFRRYRYHPILALRSALPLFFQLPFLFAAFRIISRMPALEGQSLGFILNLAAPDSLILGYNILPFVMTGINLLTALLNPDFRLREKLQAIFIALIFLAILYNAPAALLIYWSFNNLFFLLRTLVNRLRYRGKERLADPLWESFCQALPKYLEGVALPFLLLIVFANLLEYLADGEGLYFYRFSKTVPLMLASAALYFLLNWRDKGSRRYKRGQMAGILPLLSAALLHLSGIHPFPSQRYVIFAYLCGAYLVLAFILSIIQSLIPNSAPQTAHKSLQPRPSFWQNALLVFILGLIPSLHLAAVNPMYLNGWFYPLFLLLPFLLIGMAYMLLSLFSRLWRLAKGSFPPLAYSLVFTALFFYLPVLRAMMQKNSAHDGDFWLLLLGTLSLVWFFSQRQGNKELSTSARQPLARPFYVFRALLIVFFILSAFNFVSSILQGEKPSQRKLQEIPPFLTKLSLKELPNIYLFVYDGVPNPRVFREQGLPLDKLEALFERYNYTLYEDTYTLGNESLNSMAMTLNITGEEPASQSKMQDIYSGNSLINLFLRQHGYGSYNLLENYFTGTYAMINEDLITEYYPPKELSDVQSDFFLTLLRGVMQGEFRFDTKGIMAEDRHTEDDRQNRKHELIRDQVSPKFVIDQVSKPSHSQNSGKCLPNETELWIERFEEAMVYLANDLKALSEHDPNAIAIFIGDHGPSLLGDCYVLQNYKREEITAELIWDRIGTMVAIHWPDATRARKYDQNLTVNQDLFAVILAYLADDPKPLQLMPDRSFSGYGLLTRPPIHFREGKVF